MPLNKLYFYCICKNKSIYLIKDIKKQNSKCKLFSLMFNQLITT